MEVSLFRVADYALVSNDGKLSVIGLFDRVNVVNFPFQLPSMCLVAEFRARSFECGRTFRFELNLVDEDGQNVIGAGGEFTVGNDLGMPSIAIPQIFTLTQVTFVHPGRHEFSIMVNDDLKATIPFDVVQLQPAAG